MSIPDQLIKLSRYYGSNPDFVIAGGGNTSYKKGDSLWIKASGVSLADIDGSGFVRLSRKKLEKISGAVYDMNPVKREEEVKQDLLNAVMEGDSKRPSVETSLHNLFSSAYVVHTHPTSVNALLCSAEAEKETKRLFGNRVLFISYFDPGYVLFSKVQKEMRHYKDSLGMEPDIVFLRNHGLIIAGDNEEEILRKTNSILRAIEMQFKFRISSAITEMTEEKQLDIIDSLSKHLSQYDLHLNYRSNELIKHFTRDYNIYQKVARPLTPDYIVYCKSEYMYAENLNTEDILRDIKSFEQKTGYFPHIIALRNKGLISTGKSMGSSRRAMDVYNDMLKVVFLSYNFGGPNYLTDKQIAFIDNWEAEIYRRKL